MPQYDILVAQIRAKRDHYAEILRDALRQAAEDDPTLVTDDWGDTRTVEEFIEAHLFDLDGLPLDADPGVTWCSGQLFAADELLRGEESRSRLSPEEQGMVIVTVKGGVIQSLLASHPITLVTIDYDTDGLDPERVTRTPAGHAAVVAEDAILPDPALVEEVLGWALGHRHSTPSPDAGTSPVPRRPITIDSVQTAFDHARYACPACGAETVIAIDTHAVETTLYREMRCPVCAARWTVVWEMDRVLVYGQGDDPDIFTHEEELYAPNSAHRSR